MITNDVVLNILKDIRCFNTRGEFVELTFHLNSLGSKLINVNPSILSSKKSRSKQ